nr:MAG TPA: hypothetical protein [Caudoviricetes sp.]
MDELMKKVVEKLNLSIDKAPEIYEGLKKQYVIYNTCNTILEILFFIVMVGLMLGIIFGQEEIISRKNLKLIGIGLTVIFIIGIGILIFRNINTPDIVFLKGMMGR